MVLLLLREGEILTRYFRYYMDAKKFANSVDSYPRFTGLGWAVDY